MGFVRTFSALLFFLQIIQELTAFPSDEELGKTLGNALAESTKSVNKARVSYKCPGEMSKMFTLKDNKDCVVSWDFAIRAAESCQLPVARSLLFVHLRGHMDPKTLIDLLMNLKQGGKILELHVSDEQWKPAICKKDAAIQPSVPKLKLRNFAGAVTQAKITDQSVTISNLTREYFQTAAAKEKVAYSISNGKCLISKADIQEAFKHNDKMLEEIDKLVLIPDYKVALDIVYCIAYNREYRQKFFNALVDSYLDINAPTELLFMPAADKEHCQISVPHAKELVAGNKVFKVDAHQLFQTSADEKFTQKTLTAIWDQQNVNDAYVVDSEQIYMLAPCNKLPKWQEISNKFEKEFGNALAYSYLDKKCRSAYFTDEVFVPNRAMDNAEDQQHYEINKPKMRMALKYCPQMKILISEFASKIINRLMKRETGPLGKPAEVGKLTVVALSNEEIVKIMEKMIHLRVKLELSGAALSKKISGNIFVSLVAYELLNSDLDEACKLERGNLFTASNEERRQAFFINMKLLKEAVKNDSCNFDVTVAYYQLIFIREQMGNEAIANSDGGKITKENVLKLMEKLNKEGNLLEVTDGNLINSILHLKKHEIPETHNEFIATENNRKVGEPKQLDSTWMDAQNLFLIALTKMLIDSKYDTDCKCDIQREKLFKMEFMNGKHEFFLQLPKLKEQIENCHIELKMGEHQLKVIRKILGTAGEKINIMKKEEILEILGKLKKNGSNLEVTDRTMFKFMEDMETQEGTEIHDGNGQAQSAIQPPNSLETHAAAIAMQQKFINEVADLLVLNEKKLGACNVQRKSLFKRGISNGNQDQHEFFINIEVLKLMMKNCHFELNLPSSEIQMNEKDKMQAEEIVKHLENMIKKGMKLLVTDDRVIVNILTMEKENGAVFENEVELPNGINSPREGASKPSSKSLVTANNPTVETVQLKETNGILSPSFKPGNTNSFIFGANGSTSKKSKT